MPARITVVVTDAEGHEVAVELDADTSVLVEAVAASLECSIEQVLQRAVDEQLPLLLKEDS